MCRDRITSFGEVRVTKVGVRRALPHSQSGPTYAQVMPTIIGLQLPIDWTTFGWPVRPSFDGVALATGDPQWAWSDSAPSFGIGSMENARGHVVDGISIDHVVLLVPSLDDASATLGAIGLEPRLKMKVRDRPAAFFRAGPVLEVIESPVRAASIYGIAVTVEEQLETIALKWRTMGVSVGEITPAIQQGRRIFTVHDLDAGFAVMSQDRAT